MSFRNISILIFLAIASVTNVQAKDSLAIIMSNTGSANPFWASVAQGAEDKGAELGVDVAVLAPAGGETDVAGQIAIVEDQLAKGVTGIAIAPTDPGALVPALQKAIDQGVQIVFIDKSADIDGITYIGTNNVPAATMAAEYICANVASGSEVAILQGMVNNTTGQARAKGSREGLEACGMNIVAEQPADWDTIKAQAVTENILTGNPGIKAIFASNDNMGLGAIEALRMAKMLDDVVVVGFDAISGAAESILKGEMAATIAQRPTMMGALGVESLLTLSGGGSLEAHVDTGAALVTADNAAEYK